MLPPSVEKVGKYLPSLEKEVEGGGLMLSSEIYG